MKIKPIKTDQDYQNALAEVETLWDAKPNTPAGDKLDVLTTLIEAYEADHYVIASPDPVEYLKYVMESRGMSRSELAEYLGGKSRVSEVLNRKRELSLSMIKNLHFKLGVSADLLLSRHQAR